MKAFTRGATHTRILHCKHIILPEYYRNGNYFNLDVHHKTHIGPDRTSAAHKNRFLSLSIRGYNIVSFSLDTSMENQSPVTYCQKSSGNRHTTLFQTTMPEIQTTDSHLKTSRSSGILAHITSLPSPYGIGDIGPEAYSFVDYLVSCGQKYWQILPTGPTSQIFDSSPYMSSSAFAGSPLLISPDLLVRDGLADFSRFQPNDAFSPYLVEFGKVSKFKLKLLKRTFQKNSEILKSRYFHEFLKNNVWLEDYALFMSFKNIFQGKAWFQWPEPIAAREAAALQKARRDHQELFDYFCFEQFLFHSQWSKLKAYASEKSIKLIGDIPIYIGLDSSDVWSNQELFEIDAETHRPLRVSGVPPDYFSKTGQRWGNPLYRWNSRDKIIRDKLISWWTERFKSVFSLVDVARIDHFRGFASYWAIPEKEETAINGSWVKGPGKSFFKKIMGELGNLNIIAEDLGEITPDVIALRQSLGFPGMKVLQFAFDQNPDNPFLPYNYHDKFCVVYTGTHDNDTTVGWYLSSHLNDEQRRQIKKFVNRDIHDHSDIHRDFIYLALSSTANLAILPLQDLLGFGSDCRMNIPGVPTGNWRWRCAPEFLTKEISEWLRTITTRFGRN